MNRIADFHDSLNDPRSNFPATKADLEVVVDRWPFMFNKRPLTLRELLSNLEQEGSE